MDFNTLDKEVSTEEKKLPNFSKIPYKIIKPSILK